MRLREVFQYELAYRVRSASTWIYAAFLFLIAMWGLAATADGAVVSINAPQKIAQGIVLFGGLFGMLVSAAFFGDAAIREAVIAIDSAPLTGRVVPSSASSPTTAYCCNSSDAS